MSAPEPWDLGAYPSSCRHCGAVFWYRPIDQMHAGPRPCGHAFDFLPDGTIDDSQDRADAWWQWMTKGARENAEARRQEELRARSPAKVLLDSGVNVTFHKDGSGLFKAYLDLTNESVVLSVAGRTAEEALEGLEFQIEEAREKAMEERRAHPAGS
jgi:hypothetical protein